MYRFAAQRRAITCGREGHRGVLTVSLAIEASVGRIHAGGRLRALRCRDPFGSAGDSRSGLIVMSEREQRIEVLSNVIERRMTAAFSHRVVVLRLCWELGSMRSRGRCRHRPARALHQAQKQPSRLLSRPRDPPPRRLLARGAGTSSVPVVLHAASTPEAPRVDKGVMRFLGVLKKLELVFGAEEILRTSHIRKLQRCQHIGRGGDIV